MLTPSSYSLTTASNTVKRTGNYSYRSAGDSQYFTYNFTASDEIFVRVAIYRDAFPAGDLSYFCRVIAPGGTVLGRLEINRTTNLIGIYRGDGATLLVTSTYTDPILIHRLIEWRVKIADPGGVSEIKVDGVADPTGTYTGDTKPGADTTIGSVRFGGVNGANTYYDDIAINNTDNSDGLNDNSWCGEGRVEMLNPNGNGYISQWTGQDADSVNNYLNVDEIPPDSDTTYNENHASFQVSHGGESIVRPQGIGWLLLMARYSALMALYCVSVSPLPVYEAWGTRLGLLLLMAMLGVAY